MIDLKQFYREVGTLRRLWGDKSFWADIQKVQTAHKALTVTYFNCATANATESDTLASIFMATMAEFDRRARFMKVYL